MDRLEDIANYMGDYGDIVEEYAVRALPRDEIPVGVHGLEVERRPSPGLSRTWDIGKGLITSVEGGIRDTCVSYPAPP